VGERRSQRAHGVLLHLESAALPTVHGDFTVHRYRNLFTRNAVLAVACGDLRAAEPLLARVHSSCVTSESYGSRDCDCAEQLDAALAHVARAGRGIVFYLMQEGRGAGFTAKARDRMIVQASRNTVTTFDAYERMGLGRDHRVYDEVASLRHLLGITAPLRLLTNNPDKLAALARAGVAIDGAVPLQHAPSPFNLHYLAAKSRSGHALNGTDGGAPPAEPPETVEYFEPYTLPGTPHLVYTASYLMPLAGPQWFRLHAYFDLASSCERVVLTSGLGSDRVPFVRVQREALVERFPLRGGGPLKRQWHATVRAIVDHGAGCVVFGAPDDTATCLLAHHAGASARPLVDMDDAADPNTALATALARLGVRTESPAALAVACA
jgi:GTP cyclohydrolase II